MKNTQESHPTFLTFTHQPPRWSPHAYSMVPSLSLVPHPSLGSGLSLSKMRTLSLTLMSLVSPAFPLSSQRSTCGGSHVGSGHGWLWLPTALVANPARCWASALTTSWSLAMPMEPTPPSKDWTNGRSDLQASWPQFYLIWSFIGHLAYLYYNTPTVQFSPQLLFSEI